MWTTWIREMASRGALTYEICKTGGAAGNMVMCAECVAMHVLVLVVWGVYWQLIRCMI